MNKNEGRPSQSSLACDMTAIPLTERETHLKTSRTLFSNIKEIRELPDGYEFRLEDDAKGLLCASSAFSASPRWSKYVSRGNHQNDHRRDAENAEDAPRLHLIRYP